MLAILFSFLFFSNASEDRFRAIIQYENGNVQVADKQAKFQSLVKEGESIQSASKSYVKFVTKERCYGILYDDSSAKVSGNTWEIKGNGRWLCIQGAKQNLIWQGQKLALSDAEIYFEGSKIISIKGTSTLGTETLVSGRVYDYSNIKLTSAASMEDAKTYRWFANKRLPRESFFKNLERPEGIINKRFAITPVVAIPYIDIDTSDMSNFRDEFNMSGVKAWYLFPWQEKSLYASLGIYDLKNKNSESMPRAGLNQSRYELIDLHLGQRLSHDASLSFFWTAGLSFSRLDTNYYFADGLGGTLYHRGESKYSGASIAGGASKIFFVESGFALQANLELYYARTLKRGRERVFDSQVDLDRIDTQPHINTFAIMLSLGPLLSF